MAGFETTWDELKKKSNFGRPHVAILGAGASLAAFPKGDRSGRLLPLMNNLVEVLELGESLRTYDIDPNLNFEDVYDRLAGDATLSALRELVENRVSGYFSTLKLPDEPTIYDYLVLSMRDKDYIATFNWDPFLYLACWRNDGVVTLPNTLYLHGCAIVGCCVDHRTMGLAGSRCSKCGKEFVPTRLLYPVRDKDYTSDGFISAQWKSLQFAMKHAWIVTVFGYGAPASDAAAIELLSDAWGSPEDRNLEETEIIDIRPEEELAQSWSPFIHSHHYRTKSDYFSSLLGNFPRRTCEAMWEQNMEAKFLDYQEVPRFAELSELQAWMAEVASFEKTETG